MPDTNWATELRGWVTMFIAMAAAATAYNTYRKGQGQRKLENSFRMINMFRETIEDELRERWSDLWIAASEPAGAKPGYFKARYEDGPMLCPFEDLFAEGPWDGGATYKMSEIFDLISFEALEDRVDLRIIYFELGQMMDSVHLWVSSIPPQEEGGKKFIEEYYPHFARLYKSKRIPSEWPRKTYVTI